MRERLSELEAALRTLARDLEELNRQLWKLNYHAAGLVSYLSPLGVVVGLGLIWKTGFELELLAAVLLMGLGSVVAILARPLLRVKAGMLERPPGSFLARVASGLLTTRFYNRIVQPIIADFQFEYFEAIKEGRKWRARWMRVVYTVMFFVTLLLQIPIWTARTVVALWKVGTGS